MILVWIILLPLAGGLLAWVSGRRSDLWPRVIALAAMVAQLALAVAAWWTYYGGAQTVAQPWLVEFDAPWIPQFGIRFHLALDGLSLLLILLTAVLGAISVLVSWTAIRRRVGFFHFNLLWSISGIAAAFLAIDLFLFYFSWEVLLVPLYFLIGVWGHENKARATLKFVIFTQGGGLLMLLAFLGLYFAHAHATGVYTFDYSQLQNTTLPAGLGWWLMVGLFVAFAVKLPAVPLHTWLPDAHTQAPTAGSVILAGLLLKLGAYGMIRFLIPLFPAAAHEFAPVAQVLGVIGILYGAILAFAQTDLKRLVAYSSVSHMGFVLLAIFAWNLTALQGAVVIMLAHGLSTGALFIVVGSLQDRMHTRDLNRMGGLWATMPRLGGAALFFALASLGLPGLANFVGEFLALLGVWQTGAVALTALAAGGLVAAAIYSLWLVQKVFHGENKEGRKLADLSRLEAFVMAVLIVAIVWLGVYPQTVLRTAQPALEALFK
jgi:NADH-quinone oxidoreductase subunit M